MMSRLPFYSTLLVGLIYLSVVCVSEGATITSSVRPNNSNHTKINHHGAIQGRHFGYDDDDNFGESNDDYEPELPNKKPRTVPHRKITTTSTEHPPIEKLDSSEISSTRTCATSSNSSSNLAGLLSMFGGNQVWAGIGEAAVAIAIIIGIFWIKVIAIALIAWWWYGSSGDGKFKESESYGYGPSKPVYGPPKPVYGAPVSAYGRNLVNSFDFNRLTEHVWKAVDFFEKYYNSIDGSAKKSA